MPRPGGEADKVGNRYELRWTVKCLLDILQDRADGICLEPPGPRGEGVEFEVRASAEAQYHQVKSGAGTGKRWNLRRLDGAGVLQYMKSKLQNADARFVFVSGSDAEELAELSRRAKGATDAKEFREHSLGEELRAEFDLLRTLCGNWHEGDAFQALKRVDVLHFPEEALRYTIEIQAAALIEGDSGDVCSTLAMLALDEVDKRKSLNAYAIWEHLKSKGFTRSEWPKDPSRVTSVSDATKRYIGRIRRLAIGGTNIPRPEAEQIADLLSRPDGKRAVLAAGGAGGGKSAVLEQVVAIFQERHWPVLAFRVDNLQPTQLPDGIGEQLGLPLSPAHTLAAVAQGGDAVLVIDQLDAVSLASGRHPELWDCINEIVLQALACPNMRVLLACRVFDVQNDRRLRALIGDSGVADKFDIGVLEHETVRQVVDRLGLASSKLTKKQLDLLSVPLHLKLLADVAADASPDPLAFVNAQDLYSRYWDRKQELIHLRLGRSVEWTRIIDHLADFMSEHQVLSAPRHVLDDRPHPDVSAMVSENVLVEDHGRYAFFHEGFFDYAYARRFAARGGDLLALLKGSEQHLFRRAQIRQILTYERVADRARYISDLSALLTGDGIRFHIRHAVLDALSAIPDPQRDEWDVLQSVMEDTGNPCSTFVTGILKNSLGWFELLDSLGVWAKWLAGDDDSVVDTAIRLLWTVHKQVADRIAELVEPYVGTDDRWNNRLIYLMNIGELSAGRRFFELFLRLIDTGTLDQFDGLGSKDFWFLMYSLPDQRPNWACEAIGRYFSRRLVLADEAGVANPFGSESGIIHDSRDGDGEVFAASARGAPVEFVAHVLPFIMSVVQRTAECEGEKPWVDEVWNYRHYLGHFGICDHILSATDEALAVLSRETPDALRSTRVLLADTGYETLDLLLMRVYTANPSAFADDGIAYICADPRRLEIGYEDYPEGVAIELLKAATAHCSDERFLELESTILGFYPEWERRAGNQRSRGRTQLHLLESCATSRLSGKALRSLAELRRKFPEESRTTEYLHPRGMAYIVGSPISPEQAEKMTDEQWLSAIAEYQEGHDDRIRDGKSVGGAMQLSQVLESCVKSEPGRFAELALLFPDSTAQWYFNAVLRGITGASIDAETILSVCRRCDSLSGKPCGRFIHEPVAAMAGSELPQVALDMVLWYATEHPDPEAEIWRTSSRGGDRPYYDGDPYLAGINSVRGSAAESLGDLIDGDCQLVDWLHPALERMVQDPSIAVRSCVAKALFAVLRHNRDLAVDLFMKLCDADDSLLGTRYVEYFVYYAAATHLSTLLLIMRRMFDSEDSTTATAGARQICVAALSQDDAVALVEEVLSGTESQRKGGAEVFATNLRSAEHRSLCESSLIRLFSDPSEDVRAEAAGCFHKLEDAELGEYQDLALAFVRSQAFTSEHGRLFSALKESVAVLSELICTACERFFEVTGAEIADVSKRAAFDATIAAGLIVRAYSQSDDPDVRARCLDLIDRMLQLGMRDTQELLDALVR